MEEALLKQELENHIKSNENSFKDMKLEIREIKENHLVHIQKDVNDLKVDVNEVKTDVSWLKKFLFIVAGASVGGLITGLINLLISLK